MVLSFRQRATAWLRGSSRTQAFYLRFDSHDDVRRFDELFDDAFLDRVLFAFLGLSLLGDFNTHAACQVAQCPETNAHNESADT